MNKVGDIDFSKVTIVLYGCDFVLGLAAF